MTNYTELGNVLGGAPANVVKPGEVTPITEVITPSGERIPVTPTNSGTVAGNEAANKVANS